jgi:Zn finger protein HypA/HybF involved in hydrogenase expression
MHCSKCHVVKNIQIGKYVRNNEGIIQLESVQGVCESCGTGEYLKEWDCNTCPNCGEIGILHRDTLISWD